MEIMELLMLLICSQIMHIIVDNVLYLVCSCIIHENYGINDDSVFCLLHSGSAESSIMTLTRDLVT